MVAGWRKEWGQGDFPFYFCQIAPFKYGGVDKEQLCGLWEGQYQALSDIKNCGMASTVDIADVNNIHPTNKQDVGKRLALIALANTYKKDGVNWENPTFSKLKINGTKLELSFKNSAGGLKSKDGKPIREFAVAGENGRYFPAKAVIEKDLVLLSSPEVKSPLTVKYSWRNGANPNLVNSAGLPVLPFKTVHNLHGGKNNHALGKPYNSSDHNNFGWHGGLTDGSFASEQKHCFATSTGQKFPKNVVVDLQKTIPIKSVLVGVPCFGSTKKVDVSVSKDNKSFTSIGTLEFGQGKADKKSVKSADPIPARYVKLDYLDKHPNMVTFDPNFMFTTEVMVFSE